ncbi:MAG: hypothetical protein K6E73_00810 [Bacteroidales bacterium]|nr:hypothetical protein [Bacteroidales bacterium]
MKERQNTPQKVYYLEEKLSSDTPICRYMNFDAFLQILNGKFYVPRKSKLLDLRENGEIPLKDRFQPHPANVKVSDEELQKSFDATNAFIENLKKSKSLLTSCWMNSEQENYLMWKAYSDRIGIRIQTTIDKLMDALYLTDHIAICARMKYQAINIGTEESSISSLLIKEPYYQSENEIRFYFIPKKYFPNDISSKSDTELPAIIEKAFCDAIETEGKDNAESHTFVIDPKKLIENITISPFIFDNTFRHFFDILVKQFPEIFPNANCIRGDIWGDGKIRKSQILLNQ